jgi:hypothetical protein
VLDAAQRGVHLHLPYPPPPGSATDIHIIQEIKKHCINENFRWIKISSSPAMEILVEIKFFANAVKVTISSMIDR